MLCLKNANGFPGQFRLQVVFYNQVLESESLTTDPTRTEQAYAPVLTVDSDKISSLEFTVDNVASLVNYLSNGSKMFLRVLGSKSDLFYFQCQVSTEKFLSTLAQQRHLEVQLQGTQTRLILGAVGLWYNIKSAGGRLFVGQTTSNHSASKEKSPINPFLAQEVSVDQQMLKNEQIRKRVRINNALLKKGTEQNAIQQMQLGEAYLIQ